MTIGDLITRNASRHPDKPGIQFVGEICARSPFLMKGDSEKPELTADAFRGDWLHTGDMGFVHGDGFLFVADRKKDMIISGGENIYPREVEEVLYRHLAVLEAVVIGAPDLKWGETVKDFGGELQEVERRRVLHSSDDLRFGNGCSHLLPQVGTSTRLRQDPSACRRRRPRENEAPMVGIAAAAQAKR